MARKKSEFLRALGVMLECWKAIVDAVLSLGGGDDDLRRIVTEKGLALKIAHDIMDSVKPVVKTVVSRWQELLASCKQYWVNPDFTEARWPLEPVVADEAEWEVGEHFFDDDATGEEKLLRLAEMVKKGDVRLCGIRRAMEYVATHLDVQLNHPLVVPLSAQYSDGGLCLPTFLYDWDVSGGRWLGLYDVSGQFGSLCGWLVLRKRP